MRSNTAGTFTYADCPDKIVYRVTVSNESSMGFNVVGIGKKSEFCNRYFTDNQTFDAGSCTATSGKLVEDHGKYGTLLDTWTKTMSAKRTPPAGLTRNLKE